ncbi:MAG: hypothetical protein QOG43_672 [Actinomycetota bacterium]|jgi:hypothetical protein|nr:hypothetical protein [Actinomycetota bacterium]
MIGSAVGELLSGMEKVVKDLDPEALSGPESLEQFSAFHRIERLAAAGKALCARQMAATQAWFSAGHRSPCHFLAEATGSSVRHAVDLLEAAEAMKALPATEERFRSGSLTEAQAIEVASASVADPASEAELLELAALESFVELQRAAARVRAAATDDEERHRRAHRRRHFRHWIDVEGSFRFSGSLTPEAGAVLMAGMEPHRQAISRRAAEADAGRKRRRDCDAAVAADDLVEMARHAAAAQPGDPLRPTPAAMIHVRVDHAALERGHTKRGEVCEVPGVGPVTVGWVQSLLPDAVVAALEVEDGEVLKVAHLGRVIPATVRTALIERNRVCVVPGCCVDSDLEIDHIRPVASGGRSQLANLCRLCRFHHYLKTHHRWRISRAGKRWLWEGPHGPPPDPHARQPELTAAGG